jgi:hypothetical protein
MGDGHRSLLGRLASGMRWAAVVMLSGCVQMYVPSACLDRCAERNDYCLLQALSPVEVRRCDEGTSLCVRACYER